MEHVRKARFSNTTTACRNTSQWAHQNYTQLRTCHRNHRNSTLHNTDYRMRLICTKHKIKASPRATMLPHQLLNCHFYSHQLSSAHRLLFSRVQPLALRQLSTTSRSPSHLGLFSPNRQPLTPASSNGQKPNAIPSGKAAEQPFVLFPNQYLSWHELERHYGPARQHFHSDDAYKSARHDWAKIIKLDEPP